MEQTHPCPLVVTAAFITVKSLTMRPSLLGSRFYCVTAEMVTKWSHDNDKIAFGKFCTDWTGIVDNDIFGVKEKEQQVDVSLDVT